MLNTIEFIEKKRDGGKHTETEIRSLVDALMASELPDYQLSAWLMAAYLNGLDDEEVMYLTEALAHSGETISYPTGRGIIDKHSTGGVGDKTTIILIPLVAACGAKISKLSGPGLGYTGGTVDKLESIPGMNIHLSEIKFREQVENIGCAISGHSLKLAPAEGKFYKLRDVTGTVPSIPLITSSIISKKLAGGAYGYLFDVKCGSGAFMQNERDARALAEKLTAISKKLGKKCISVISDMEQPLGEWVGNASEVYESILVLKGVGPADTRELCLTLGGHMLAMSGVCGNASDGFKKCREALDDGAALKKFAELIEAQGGDSSIIAHPEKFMLPPGQHCHEIKTDRSGSLSKLSAILVGEGLRALGGGRLRQEDSIDPHVSVQICAKIGDRINNGDTLMCVYYSNESQLEAALPYLSSCWAVSDHADKRKLIIDTIY